MLMPAPFQNTACSRAGSVDSPNTGGSQPCLWTVRTAWRSCERKSSCRSSPLFLTSTKTRRCGLRTTPGRPQAHAGFRSEFDPARFTSMAHGPTVAVVSECTSSRATAGNRVRPKNALRSRPSWGTQPRRQETLGQRSHPNFRKGTLNGAVVNSILLSEKHCHVIFAVLRLTLLFTVTYDGMSFGSTIARINPSSPLQWTSVTREN
jgi:hypothetical protein